jgi:4-amino-4-deoxy-L-arabinose transferase-like glycosyltransferase
MVAESASSEPGPSDAEASGSGPRSGPAPLVVLAVFALILSSFSWARDFWAPEEDDFAAATQSMARSGEWMLPRLAGEPYLEKPPLLYWSGRTIEAVLRLPPEVAYRLAAAAFAVLGLWVTFIGGARLFDREVGLAAMAIQGTTVLQFRCGAWYLSDGLFATCISLSLVSFAIALLREPRSVRWKALGYLGLAGACLSKSVLLAPYLVGATLIAFAILHRRSAAFLLDLRRLRPLAGLAGAALLVLPWFLWIAFQGLGGAIVDEMFIEHHLDRLVDAASHQRGGWYYFATLPGDFLPWAIFLPLAALHGHAHFAKPSQKFLWIWFLAAFVSLSLMSSKQGKYLLPVWTPLSLLAASGLLCKQRESIWELFLGRELLRAAPMALKALAAILLVAGLVVASGLAGGVLRPFGWDAEKHPQVAALIESGGIRVKVLVWTLLLSAALYLVSRPLRARIAEGRIDRAILALGLVFALGFFAATFFYSDLNAVKSAKRFCAEAETRIEAGRPAAIYGRPRGSILYYLDRPLKVMARVDASGSSREAELALESYLRAPERVYLLIIESELKSLTENYPKFKDMVRELHAGKVGSRRTYLLLSNAR